MSLDSKIVKLVDSHVLSVLTKISKKFSIDLKELVKMSKTDSDDESNPVVSAVINAAKKEKLDVSAFSVAELKEKCREKNLPTTGNKTVLLERLNSGVSKPPKAKKEKTPEVIQTLIAKKPELSVKVNAFGNLEHKETHLVFNNKNDQVVIGTQNDDGELDELTPADIQMCKKYGFNKYVLPKNLETETPHIEIDEIENEDEDEEVEIDSD